LDISDLVASPRTSPFALALSSASHMLVVPNQQGSIYARVWCCYEAFLAHSGKKFIVKALSRLPGFWPKVLRMAFLFLAGDGAGHLLCFVLFMKQNLMFLEVLGPLLLVLTLIGLMYLWLRKLPSSRAFRAILTVAAFLWGFLVSFSTTFVGDRLWSIWLFYPGMLILSATLEADRLWLAEAILEASELQKGYTGCVKDAQCSQEEDKARILEEITNNGEMDALNRAVAVLLKTGICTPHLCKAADVAGDLGDATVYNLSLAFGCQWVWCCLPFVILELGDCSSSSCVLWLSSVEALLWVLIFLTMDIDRRAFAANTMSLFVLGMPLFVADFFTSHYVCRFFTWVACFWGPLIVAMSWAGPAIVAKVPMLGPAVVRCLCSDRMDIIVHCSGGGNMDTTSPLLGTTTLATV